ncbi:MAG: ABC transporter substrate-binding protein [bacterium]|nr:ABC transporter substrate-binding protein [bacterium]
MRKTHRRTAGAKRSRSWVWRAGTVLLAAVAMLAAACADTGPAEDAQARADAAAASSDAAAASSEAAAASSEASAAGAEASAASAAAGESRAAADAAAAAAAEAQAIAEAAQAAADLAQATAAGNAADVAAAEAALAAAEAAVAEAQSTADAAQAALGAAQAEAEAARGEAEAARADAEAAAAEAAAAQEALAEAAAAAPEPPAAAEPILLGDLAYFTGDFASVGALLASQVDFPVEEVINLDPPLGRPIEVIHEDIGTVGEAQAVRKLLEQDGVDIVLSSAHEYFTYRDFMLDWQEANDGPLMPTVHGGVIPVNVGGRPYEPIFRAQGSDEGQGVTNALYAEALGAGAVVIMTTPTAGYQLTADATEKALDVIGIELLDRIDAPGEQSSYRTEIQRAVDAAPDAVIILAQATESAIMVKQFAEAGWAGTILGEVGWSEPEFAATATAEALATHELVAYPSFHRQSNAAWEFYQPLWDGNPTYTQHTIADDPYSFTTYDLLIVTALAIEEAGTVNGSDWAPAMFKVSGPPGTLCYTYADCLALIRAGIDVDYEGVTGPATFSPGGINAVIPVVRIFGADGEIADQVAVDSERHLEILSQVAFQFEG